MKGHIDRVRGAVKALLADNGEGRRWQAALGRWPEMGPFLACLRSPPRGMPTSHDLAALVDSEERAFRRHVKSTIGLTPIEAVTSSKFARAAQRLRNTSAPVTTIADREGFASLAAFDHAFARYLKLPPSTFRHTDP